ncbi:TPA: hypothetical protein DIC20_01795 [Candidatus Dependentiae bacterium]|nr:MAG: hypothetical protein US03_C0001G0188 [candidate division TM6 bacterium GW2011_GWF2_36_131]KKQ03676.1 MAG: hypothetical protein US13_C0001G0016 [candidate division TM6 bacterium GW2011_GWE2_36_25]KKQ20088.1 MAG: hypothetical protein US32_C0002G0093 [candidate division TM6 bacterium GW2011_GWA2_36_9]HBR70443.1 hypothetical protein [Candidatus Dependentiae bacterium]HCU00419.1 hypothetical protein [Candidatus Dependentiae bacterium]
MKNFLLLFLVFFIPTFLSAEYIVWRQEGEKACLLSCDEFKHAYEIINTYRFPMYVYNDHISEDEKIQLDSDEQSFIQGKIQERLGANYILSFIPTTLCELYAAKLSMQQIVIAHLGKLIKRGFFDRRHIFAFQTSHAAICVDSDTSTMEDDGFLCDFMREKLDTWLDQHEKIKRVLPLLNLPSELVRHVISYIDFPSLFDKKELAIFLKKHRLFKAFDGEFYEMSDFFFCKRDIRETYPSDENCTLIWHDFFKNFNETLFSDSLICFSRALNNDLIPLYAQLRWPAIDLINQLLSELKLFISAHQFLIGHDVKHTCFEEVGFVLDNLFSRFADQFLVNAILNERDNPNDYFMYRGSEKKYVIVGEKEKLTKKHVKKFSYCFGYLLGGANNDRSYFAEDGEINMPGAVAGEFIASAPFGFAIKIDKKFYRDSIVSGNKLFFIPPCNALQAFLLGVGELFHGRTCYTCDRDREKKIEGFGFAVKTDWLLDVIYQSKLCAESLIKALKEYLVQNVVYIKCEK